MTSQNGLFPIPPQNPTDLPKVRFQTPVFRTALTLHRENATLHPQTANVETKARGRDVSQKAGHDDRRIPRRSQPRPEDDYNRCINPPDIVQHNGCLGDTRLRVQPDTQVACPQQRRLPGIPNQHPSLPEGIPRANGT